MTVFAPMKRVWRAELDEFKDECVKKNLRHATIPKERYVSYEGTYLGHKKVNKCTGT